MFKVKDIVKVVVFFIILFIIVDIILTNSVAKTKIETVDYVVKDGDTLWSVACKICSNNSNIYLQNVISDIGTINNIKDSTIYKGQIIKIPVY